MLKFWLWLTELPGLTNQARLALLRHFGTPENIFYADPGELALVEGIRQEHMAALENHKLESAEQILADCQSLDQQILTIQDAAYPSRLKNIYDPPCLLYWKGKMPAFDELPAIAVVGTRDCTPYGERCAERLSYGLTCGGALVVSGLARGIDAAASRGALRSGGVTAAVVGCGLDVFYPYENRYLYEDIAATGILMSEYPPGTRPLGRHFPARNRIISGLCLATLVVEAPERSGALITAETALEQGRDIFAVPGPIDALASVGCNRLIREGAGLVSDPWDILREYEGRFVLSEREAREEPVTLGYQAREKKEAKAAAPTLELPQTELTDDQLIILRTLELEEAMLVDDLIEKSGIPTRRVLSALTMLEIDKLVCQHSGKRYTRTVTLYE